MKNFTVIYMMPAEGLEEWTKRPEAERNAVEEPLRQEWSNWLSAHKDSVLNTIGLGKSKRVGKDGVADVKNGFMLSSYVQAESLEAAAAIFEGHPHLQIPGATIEVMEVNPLTGM